MSAYLEPTLFLELSRGHHFHIIVRNSILSEGKKVKQFEDRKV